MSNQDWDTVVLRKKAPTNAMMKDESAVNQARRQGIAIETVKKHNAGANQVTSGGLSATKLDNETEDFHINRVSSNLKVQIVQARTAKKMTQAQLAQAINEKPNVIQEYESGKAIPNPQILNKMSRILGVQLKKGA
jgi:putative transcription factor